MKPSNNRRSGEDRRKIRPSTSQISEHIYQIDDVLSQQTWENEILRDDYAEFIKNLIELELPKVRVSN